LRGSWGLASPMDAAGAVCTAAQMLQAAAKTAKKGVFVIRISRRNIFSRTRRLWQSPPKSLK
jgi:hypothetical protein